MVRVVLDYGTATRKMLRGFHYNTPRGREFNQKFTRSYCHVTDEYELDFMWKAALIYVPNQ